MNDRQDQREIGVDALRSRMDADARFHRVLSGYDPEEVRAYVEEIKRVFSQQAKAAKQEQESLIAELDSAKSEIQARNCAIKTLKETLAQREAQLTTASTRIATLLQSVKRYEAEREGLERLRAAAATARVASERAQAMEAETQQLRGTLSQAASLIESWKTERAELIDENARLRQELEYLRGLITSAPPEQTAARTAPAAPQRFTPAPPPEQSARTAPTAAPQRFVPAPAPEQAVSSQIADKLADAFAEAYTLVSQLRTAGEPPRTAQPRMQVLRPDGTSTDYTISGK